VKNGRAVRATEAAFTLIDAVPAAIADPGTTAIWEQALDMIEAGQMTLGAFIDGQSAWVAQLVQQYRGTVLSIDLPAGPVCPACGATTRQCNGRNGVFWSCSRFPDCKGTVPVESSGRRRTTSRKPRRPSPTAN
jgi:DNA topoisomerase-3